MIDWLEQVEGTEAIAPWALPPRCRATRCRVLHPRGRHRHRRAPTARWPPSPTSPTNRPFSKGCRSRRRARCARWPGRAAARRRRGAPRPRTRRASRASAVRFWGEGILITPTGGYAAFRAGRNWMILIRATVLVFERNIWDSSFTLPRESSATYRGAFTLISRYSIARC